MVYGTLRLTPLPTNQVFCEEAFPILDANAEREGGGGAGGGVFVWELKEAGEAAGGAVQIYVYAGDDEVGGGTSRVEHGMNDNARTRRGSWQSNSKPRLRVASAVLGWSAQIVVTQKHTKRRLLCRC